MVILCRPAVKNITQTQTVSDSDFKYISNKLKKLSVFPVMYFCVKTFEYYIMYLLFFHFNKFKVYSCSVWYTAEFEF